MFEPFTVRRVCGQAEWLMFRSRYVSLSRGQCFLEPGLLVLSLFLVGFSAGLHAFVLVRSVGLPPGRTRRTVNMLAPKTPETRKAKKNG